MGLDIGLVVLNMDEVVPGISENVSKLRGWFRK